MNEFILLVSGSRSLERREGGKAWAMEHIGNAIQARTLTAYGPLEIVSGGASGPDRWATDLGGTYGRTRVMLPGGGLVLGHGEHDFWWQLSQAEPGKLLVMTGEEGCFSGSDAVLVGAKHLSPLSPSWKIEDAIFRLKDAASAQGTTVSADIWERYVNAYKQEMREVWRKNRGAFAELLQRKRATLLCSCPDPARCHRRVLADILVSTGYATYGGEWAASPLGRNRAMVDYLVEKRELGAHTSVLALIDPESATRGTSFTAALARGEGIDVEVKFFGKDGP